MDREKIGNVKSKAQNSVHFPGVEFSNDWNEYVWKSTWSNSRGSITVILLYCRSTTSFDVEVFHRSLIV